MKEDVSGLNRADYQAADQSETLCRAELACPDGAGRRGL